MTRTLLVFALVMLCGCDVRQNLDIGSAKAIKELQGAHNELLGVVQQGAHNDAKEGTALVKEFPDNHQLKETSKAAERIAEKAASLAKVERDPYASLGPINGLIERINWLFSEEGLVYVFGLIAAALGYGNISALGKARRAHKADPSQNFKDI